MKYFEYKNNRLHFHQFKLEQLSSKFPTPFFIYSEDILTQNYLEFMSGAQNAKLLNPMICFALKSNPNKDLLKILAKMGSGADIVSGGELQRAIEAGIPAERIVFSGVGKTKEEIELALTISKNGIYSFNVESIEELELINLCAKKLNKLARICFRLNPVVAAKTHKHISTGNKTHKFGLLETDILNALKNKKNWTHSKLVGLSVHIGSQLLDLKATKKALIILSQVAIKTQVPLEFLDVGGGLGVDYHQNDTSKLPKISDYMNLVSDTLTKHYYQKSDFKPRVIFEPGRRIVAKAGLLMMKVIRNKISESNRFVIVDGGMNDFMRPSLYGAYHELLPLKKSHKSVPSHVVGPICETSDCFATNRMLPELKAGDFIALCDTGAYGYSMGSNYNLRNRPMEILITKNEKIKIINHPQTYEDLK